MNKITILENEQVKYIKIVEDIKESLSKVLFTKEVSDIGLANEDMNKGAIIAYQDIYNRIVELEHIDEYFDKYKAESEVKE